MKLKLRLATENDLLTIFNLSNDSLTRQMSFNQDIIPMHDHRIWFEKILTSLSTYLYLIENEDGKVISQVRFDNDGEISVSIAKEFRGKGLAIDIIKLAINSVKIPMIVAHVKQENIKMIRVFDNIGFKFDGRAIVKGYECLRYVYFTGY